MRPNFEPVRPPDIALLGHQHIDHFGRGYVEYRIECGRTRRRNHLVAAASQFLRPALFNLDGRAIGQIAVYSRRRRHDHQPHAVILGRHGQTVGADLVGGIPIGGDAIGTDDDPVHQPALHERGRGRIDDELKRDLLALQFPGGQTRPLQPGPGLADPHLLQPARAPGAADYPKRCTPATGGQGSCIAMGQDPTGIVEQSRARFPHSPIGLRVFGVQAPCFGQQRVLQGLPCADFDGQHPLHGPLQMYRGRPCSAQTFRRRGQAGESVPGRQHQSVGRRNADRGGSAHLHAADGFDHLLDAFQGLIMLASWQLGLVEDFQPFVPPTQGLDGDFCCLFNAHAGPKVVVCGIFCAPSPRLSASRSRQLRMQNIDLIISARWIVPVEPHEVVLHDHVVAVHAGRIVDVIPRAQARATYSAASQVELPDHALIPGLVNAHGHAAMSLLRGVADDLPLQHWLEQHIWPLEARFVDADFCRIGVNLAIAELLRGGVTCMNDMYFFTESTAQAAAGAGMRACVGMIVLDFPTRYAQNPDEYLRKGLALRDEYKGHPLITTSFAPHAPYTVSDEPLARIRTLADELDVPVHMHVHETAFEVAQSQQQYGQRPLSRLHHLGLVSTSLVAVHMTQLDDAEIEALALAKAHVVHCPESNLKLASGLCPVQKLLDAGVNVALGTDGAASNNDLDMFGEMRTAALIGKHTAGDASAVPASMALRMATLNGARALKLGAETGSVEVGKWADLCAVDLSGLEQQPLYDPISQIVYATSRDRVSEVWVAGKQLLRDRQLTTIDCRDLLAQVREAGDRIREAMPS